MDFYAITSFRGDQIIPTPLFNDFINTIDFLLCSIRLYECIKYDKVVPLKSLIDF